MKPGRLARADYEYERHVFMFFAPLKGWRHIEVTGRRTAISAISCFEAIAREVTAEEISVNSGGRWSLIISEAIAGIPPENKDSAYVEFEPWDECGYGSFY